MAAKGKKPLFGGKKAAPFAKGGGRKQSSPKTAKGTTKKSAKKGR
jgi:hypothetical protein